jgi:hypothetical protein
LAGGEFDILWLDNADLEAFFGAEVLELVDVAGAGAAEVEVVALYDDGRGNNLYEKAVDEILGRECEKLGCALEDGEAVDASLGKVMGFEVEGC